MKRLSLNTGVAYTFSGAWPIKLLWITAATGDDLSLKINGTQYDLQAGVATETYDLTSLFHGRLSTMRVNTNDGTSLTLYYSD